MPTMSSPDPHSSTILSATSARAGQRVGMIKVLVISTALAVMALLGFWGFNARHMSTASEARPAATAPKAAAQTFNVPSDQAVKSVPST